VSAPPADRVTRRHLLQAGGAALALAAVGGAGRAVTAGAAPRAAAGLRRSRFAPYVGERFRLTAPDGTTVHAGLVAVDDYAARALPALRGSEDAFVLIFRGPVAPRLEQAVLDIRHRRTGRVSLLASPASRGARGQDYTVVVNQLPDARMEHR
jgi:hypothetical protein